MRETKPTDRFVSDRHDEKSRRGKTVETKLDPRHLRKEQPFAITDDRWLESLLEEPERWDGMS